MVDRTLKNNAVRISSLIAVCLALSSCSETGSDETSIDAPAAPENNALEQPMAGEGVEASSAETLIIDLNNTFEYSNQFVPSYIQKDNTGENSITNAGASLGRVLFYDTKLSTSDDVSCATCHQQSLGFSDSNIASRGVNGTTGRHSMRLINTRFSEETRFFWDERADTLENQTTQPIRDFVEMGFSGIDGAPAFDDLLTKLSGTAYYPELFTQAFGNSVITEQRMQNALAQFIRSIQSFDSRYDEGLALARNPNAAFSNFSSEENEGKRLFTERGRFNAVTGQRQVGGGLGCNGCHQAPEFDIDENSRNNGVISVLGNVLATDLNNTRSPTLRDLFDSNGRENGPFMHDGSLNTFDAVLDHYNDITADRQENRNLDARLNGAGGPGNNNAPGQKLLLTEAERSAITAFMRTLSGQSVYQDPRWSNPFADDGSLILSR